MPLRELRILVVDDNPSDRLIVKAMLQKLKVATVHTAEDGVIAEAKVLSALEMSQTYQIIILDWNMPKSNGAKLLKFLRAHPRLKTTKVIIMTATSDRAVVESAIEGGANDFIVKPVELELLQKKIEKTLER